MWRQSSISPVPGMVSTSVTGESNGRHPLRNHRSTQAWPRVTCSPGFGHWQTWWQNDGLAEALAILACENNDRAVGDKARGRCSFDGAWKTRAACEHPVLDLPSRRTVTADESKDQVL